jgi:hypothetical protein
VANRVGEDHDHSLTGRIDLDLAPIGDGDLGLRGGGFGLGQENAFPAAARRRHLEDVDRFADPFLVEDPRLDLLRHGLGHDVEAQLLQRVVAPGQDVDHQQGVEDREHRRDQQHRAIQGQQADAAGAHRGQLAVRGKAADRDQDAEEQ